MFHSGRWGYPDVGEYLWGNYRLLVYYFCMIHVTLGIITNLLVTNGTKQFIRPRVRLGRELQEYGNGN